MEGITLGQIAVAVAFLVALISGISYLHKHLKEWIAQSLKDQLDSIKTEIKGLRTRIDEVDMESTKNFLVRVLSDIEQETPVDEVERLRFWEAYQHYSKMGGNSYIRDKIEKLQKAGKL
jgi:hypothetical protein